MIIIIGNQKGGAGKSTIALLFANYFTSTKKLPVTVLDMDYQRSISEKYEKAKVLENPEPYEVIKADLEIYPQMLPILLQNKGSITIIDLPGKLDDDGLIPVIESADLIICPFSYDEFTFNSTIFFSVVTRKLNTNVPMVYIPNRIKPNVKYETKEQIDEQITKFGKITPPIMERIDFQRVSTFQTPLSVYPVIVPVFELIYNQFLSQILIPADI